MKAQKQRFKGLRLTALYAMMNVMRSLGMGHTPEKAIAQPVAVRKAMRAASWTTMPPPKEVRMELGSISGRSGPIAIKKYLPPKLDPKCPWVLFLHGGGWIHGGLDTLDHLCASVSLQAACMIVSVDYRLAPETPFPGGLEDCDDALNWLANDSSLGPMPAAGIVVMGESAGGNLGAALCVLSARRGYPAISKQILIYPALDLTLGSESWNIDQPGLERDNVVRALVLYTGKTPLTDPLLSPLFAENPSALPPALILTADIDPIRDDGPRFARKLNDAGDGARVVNYIGMPHGFFFVPRIASGAKEGIAEISKDIRAMARG
ncbi:acetyl esterase [Solimonas aquatica]|uniref:Acetyl esterase n=1 Tax=Solimonas aquatica TaxID=489703 RepID=A0A1H9AA45_9GAMM|nr:alpha/beta hydrolase [Solimonas aquatica]SEP73529.1 acetyl esterase [Solimonas aquatica]